MPDAATEAIEQLQTTLERHEEALRQLALAGPEMLEGAKALEADLGKQANVVTHLGAELDLCKRALETADKRVDALERRVAEFDAFTRKGFENLSDRIDAMACDLAEVKAAVEQLAAMARGAA